MLLTRNSYSFSYLIAEYDIIYLNISFIFRRAITYRFKFGEHYARSLFFSIPQNKSVLFWKIHLLVKKQKHNKQKPFELTFLVLWKIIMLSTYVCLTLTLCVFPSISLWWLILVLEWWWCLPWWWCTASSAHSSHPLVASTLSSST